MHITFFVGNGFDIACGIQSSYSSFYKWYCTQEIEEESGKDHIKNFRSTIDSDIKAGKKNWADFEEALGEYTGQFTKETAEEFIDCYEDAHKNLMKYLANETARFQDDFDESAIKSFRDGLKNFYAELRPKERRQFEELFKSHHLESSSIEFVSYNYTDTLDKIVSVAAKEPLDTWSNSNGRRCTYTISSKVIHAHGQLNYHPIFGVNDENQIANKTLFEIPDFANLMIKPLCVEELGELWHDEADARIKDSTIICIFGMSMGITDSVWFYKIMDWLRESESRHLIIFYHTNHPTDGISNRDTFANVRRARNKIIDYSDYTDQQIEKIRPRIHVIENTKSVLQLKLIEKKS